MQVRAPSRLFVIVVAWVGASACPDCSRMPLPENAPFPGEPGTTFPTPPWNARPDDAGAGGSTDAGSSGNPGAGRDGGGDASVDAAVPWLLLSEDGGPLPANDAGEYAPPAHAVQCEVPLEERLRHVADILLLVDNSGSMAEEHMLLSRDISSLCPPATSCSRPCGEMARVEALRQFLLTGPGCGVDPEQWGVMLGSDGSYFSAILRDCGFMERLYVHDVDWQLGVTTTDRRALDGFDANGTIICTGGMFPPGRGPLPQAGCLVPTPSGVRVLHANKGTHPDHVDMVRAMIANVGTCGSGVEEGLRKVTGLVTGAEPPSSPECAGDARRLFRRRSCARAGDGGCERMGPEPVAAVLVLADEDDCSFPLGDPEWPEGALTISPRCYSRADELVDTDAFARELIAVKGSAARVRVGTIVGGRWLDDVQFAAEACRCNSQHEGAVPVNNCRAMRGNSIASQCGTIMPSPYCPGLRVPSDGSELCCTGDPAHRYLRFARRFPHVMESICQQTYSPVLARLADLAR